MTTQNTPLLNLFGLQKMQQGAEGETGQRFYNRDSFKNTAANLAMGLNSMRLNPDASLPQRMQAQIAQRKQNRTRNRTVEALRKKAEGGDKLAAKYLGAIESGALPVAQAMSAYMQESAQIRAEGRRLAAARGAEDRAEARARAAAELALKNRAPSTFMEKFNLWKQSNPDGTYDDFIKNEAAVNAGATSASALTQEFALFKADNPDGTYNDFLALKNQSKTADQKNYETAVAGGYTGTFTDFLQLKDAGEQTAGQKKQDQGFADIANTWATTGRADAFKLTEQLEEVVTALESGKNLTGYDVGIMPDFILAYTNPDAIDAREAVQEVIARNLKEILGGQFAQKEGENLLARAYNPLLDEKQNLRRVKAVLEMMKAAAMQKEQKVRYFEENGTLTGLTTEVIGEEINTGTLRELIGRLDKQDGISQDSGGSDDSATDYSSLSNDALADALLNSPPGSKEAGAIANEMASRRMIASD